MKHNSKVLHKADMVRIRFEFQKSDRRDVIVHMFASGDSTLCPVIAWAFTVRRVWKIPTASDSSEVCLFQSSKMKTARLIQADHVRSKLRSIVDIIGEDSLCFSKTDVGLHSIRAGGAMAMFLSGTPTIIIMRVGRWLSKAFLEYIRDQVETFTYGVSRRMIKCEKFFDLNSDMKNLRVLDNDPDHQTQNENGPESVPFNIRFNQLALNETAPGIE